MRVALRAAALGASALLALTTAAPFARAEPPGADDADVAARLAYIERALDAEEASTRLWRTSWLAAYGSVVLAETGLLAIATTPATRVSAGVSIGQASIAFTFRRLSPATGADAATTLRAMRGETPVERRERLHAAEALLRRVATEERFSHAWFPLLGGALIVTGGAWINFAAVRGNAGGGWFAATSGLAVAELEFHTQPTGALRAWDAYRLHGAAARVTPAPALPSVAVVPGPGGLALRGSF